MDYVEKNRQSWNKRTDYHIKSDFYDLNNFLKGKSSLHNIELKLLGNISNKSILHLQCHFGQDTISLGRLGASVIGVDLSDNAINKAKSLSDQTNTKVSFICCDIYDLPQHLDKQFDIVFISYGAIGWLPDLNKWGQIISRFLKSNGKLILVEFHPVFVMFENYFEKVDYSYFNRGPVIYTDSGTYADKNAIINQEYVLWNHPISDILNNLIKNNLEINSFDEFDYSPDNRLGETIEFEPGKYRTKDHDNKIPMVYAIVATKKNNS